jgi:hypothetical protein
MNWYNIFKYSQSNVFQYDKITEDLIKKQIIENKGECVGPYKVDDDSLEILGYIAVEPDIGSSLLIFPGEDVKQRF